MLADIFSEDMQMCEQQAAEIESRLTNLRQQYQAREKVKEEIIGLQLKVIGQDAAGLGFSGGQSSAPTLPVDIIRANLPTSATPMLRVSVTVRGGGTCHVHDPRWGEPWQYESPDACHHYCHCRPCVGR